MKLAASVSGMDGAAFTTLAQVAVECLGIDRWVFLSQLERQPKVTIRLLQILAQRLRGSDARFVEQAAVPLLAISGIWAI